MYMCLKCQRHERRILLGLLSRGQLRSMSRCVCIHTLPFHLDIGATVHMSQVSETRTQDIVGFTNSESGVTVKYVTVCVSVLQCVLQCVAVCCSVLQCVAVCFSSAVCACIHTFPFHVCIGASTHVSQVSETRTKDIVGFDISELGAKYVTVRIYAHTALPCVHRCYCACVSSVRDMNQGYCQIPNLAFGTSEFEGSRNDTNKESDESNEQTLLEQSF